MSLYDYIEKHDFNFPFGSEEKAGLMILDFERCKDEEEIKWYANLVVEHEDPEDWKLFKDYCLETNSLPHIFSPNHDGIADSI